MGKIVLLSYFKSSNIGDLLIAEYVTEIFEERFNLEYRDMNFSKIDFSKWREKDGIFLEPKPSIFVRGKRKILKIPFLGDWLISLKSRKSILPDLAVEACHKGDMVIFAGGNSIMDLGRFPAYIRISYNIVKVLKAKGVSVGYCFCGVGPFRSRKSLKIAKELFKEIDYISVRDESSYELVKRLVPEKKVEIWRDPVLLKPQEQVGTEKKKAIGVNVYFGCESNKAKKVKKAFIEVVSKLRKRYPEYKIKLFSSEYRDYRDVEKVKKAFVQDEQVEIVLIKNEKDLFSFYGKVDVILGTRMHTIITSLVSGVASVTVSWQEKVESLSRFFGNSDFNFTLSEFITSPNCIVEKMQECLEKREEIILKNQETLTRIRKETGKKVEEFFKGIEDNGVLL